MKHTIDTKKIAMIFPYAPSYRSAIYQLMDEEFEIDWFFAGDAKRNLKLLDYSLLKNCSLTLHEKKILPRVTTLSGVSKIHYEKYHAIIIPGVLRCLSDWWILLKLRLTPRSPKVYLWTHGWYGKESFLQSIIKKIFFSGATGIFLYGKYAKSLMLKNGFSESKLHVIHNSLNYEKQLDLRKKLRSNELYRRHFKNEFPVLIFIGRLTFVKQLNLLIEAVSILRNEKEFFNIALIGDGEARPQLEELTRQRELSEQVWFYGECFDEQTNAELLHNADLCVSPGNVGLTSIHALMFGCPVLTHNDFKWQMPEFEAVREGETGSFFTRGDIQSLANAISNWFKKNALARDTVRHACYDEIDEFWTPKFQVNLLKKVLFHEEEN